MLRLALLAGFFWACAPETALPGDQAIGTYSFQATPLELDCNVDDIPQGGFTFTGAFSRESSTGEAWFRLNNVIRDAAFDGQVMTAEYTAPRVYGRQCDGCSTELKESFVLAILSKAQNDASGDACPPSAIDGGLPAGVSGPGRVETGFDAVRACGEWVDQIVATPLEGSSCDPACGLCRLRYSVVGARR